MEPEVNASVAEPDESSVSAPEPIVRPPREDVQFDSGDSWCAAWWYRPSVVGAPVIVMAHGFAATREKRLDSFAEVFVRAGYGVVLFDYRHFGDSGGEPRLLLSLKKEHQDWEQAIAWARQAAPESPIVLWGTSLSGGHVLRAASYDHDIAAVIAQVPHVSGMAATKSVGPIQSVRLGVAAMRDQIGGWLGRPPYLIESIGEPGSLAAMTAPGSVEGLERMLAARIEQTETTNLVAARVILEMGRYIPGRRVKHITCPVLVQVTKDDAVTPAAATRAAVAGRANVELREYPGGHFDPYVPPLFTQVVSDDLEFLRRVVPVPA